MFYWIIYCLLAVIGSIIYRLDLSSFWLALSIALLFAAVDTNAEIRTRKEIVKDFLDKLEEAKESCVETQD